MLLLWFRGDFSAHTFLFLCVLWYFFRHSFPPTKSRHHHRANTHTLFSFSYIFTVALPMSKQLCEVSDDIFLIKENFFIASIFQSNGFSILICWVSAINSQLIENILTIFYSEAWNDFFFSLSGASAGAKSATQTREYCCEGRRSLQNASR